MPKGLEQTLAFAMTDGVSKCHRGFAYAESLGRLTEREGGDRFGRPVGRPESGGERPASRISDNVFPSEMLASSDFR